MNIPNDILFLIYQEFTSVHDLHSCSLVNKHWHSIARDPLFYKHVNIYSDDQLMSFTKTMTSMKYENELMGHYVKKITLYTGIIIPKDKLANFQQCFPNITDINFKTLISIHYTPIFKIIKTWNHLTKLPYLHVESTLDCLKHLKNNLNTLRLIISEENWEDLLPKGGKLSPELEYISKLIHLKTLCLVIDSCNNYDKSSLSILNLFHSICPQINSLTIDHDLNFIHSNNTITTSSLSTLSPKVLFKRQWNNIITSLSSSSLSTGLFKHQWNNITTLCFKGIKARDTLFFSYISQCYPNLQSLTLDINQSHLFGDYYGDFHDDFSTDPSTLDEYEYDEYIEIYKYRQCIENMVIKLSQQLKKLHLSFKTPTSIWPNNKLLNYLQLNPPTQLKDLKWPLTIYPSRVETMDYGFHYHEYVCNDIKPTGFFNRLEILYLSLPYSGSDTLTYLLKKDHSNHSPISLLSNLKELTVEKIKNERSKPKFYLYHWLDTFSNIQSLIVIDVEVINKESVDDNDDNNNNKKEKEEKMINHLSHYKLQKLAMKQCDIQLKGGFHLLCERCPHLNHLQCTNSNYMYDSSDSYITNDIMEKMKKLYPFFNNYYPFIYSPHTNLETFILDRLTIHEYTKSIDYECLLLTKNDKMAPQLYYFIKEEEDDDFEIKEDAIVVYVNNIEKCYSGYNWILF